MGREPWSSRLCVEDCLYGLAAERMQRDGVFQSPLGTVWTTNFNDANGKVEAVLSYSVQEIPSGGLGLVVDPELGGYTSQQLRLPARYVIPITSTRPHLGGMRYWFRCPRKIDGKACDERVGRLYLPPGESVFGCRRYFNLTYRSAQQHDKRKDALARDPDALMQGFAKFLRWLREVSQH